MPAASCSYSDEAVVAATLHATDLFAYKSTEAVDARFEAQPRTWGDTLAAPLRTFGAGESVATPTAAATLLFKNKRARVGE